MARRKNQTYYQDGEYSYANFQKKLQRENDAKNGVYSYNDFQYKLKQDQKQQQAAAQKEQEEYESWYQDFVQKQQEAQEAEMARIRAERAPIENVNAHQQKVNQGYPSSYDPFEYFARDMTRNGELTEKTVNDGSVDWVQRWEQWIRDPNKPLWQQAEEAEKAAAEAKKSPMQKYSELPDNLKGRWLQPSSKEVNQIRSVEAAKTYVNNLPAYDTKATSKELLQWQKDQERNQRKAEEEKNKLLTRRGLMSPEEIQQAKEEAAEMRGKANENYLMYLETEGIENDLFATSGLKKEYITGRPEDYETYQNDWDGWLYDKIYGQGEYQKRIDAMETDADADILEAELNDLWNRLENKTLHELPDLNRNMQAAKRRELELTDTVSASSPALREAESKARYAKDKAAELEAQLKHEQTYQDLMGETPANKAVFTEADDRGGEAYRSAADLERGVRTDDVHRIASFINGGKEWTSWLGGQWMHGLEAETARATDEYSGAIFMRPEEVAKFNEYYLDKKDYDGAKAFFKGLQPYLNERYRPFEEMNTAVTTKQLPITTNVTSVASRAANTLVAPVREVAGWLGDESVKDPNSRWYATTRLAQDIENTTAADIEKNLGTVPAKGYRSFMNSMRNVVNGLMTAGMGLTGAPQKVASLLTFASQIYQESTYEHLNETGDYDSARGLAALDALMETLEEMLPYETMLSGSNGHALLYFAKNALSEAGEEFTGATVGEYIKGQITGRDSLEKRADEIYNNKGYYDDAGNWVELNGNRRDALKEADLQALKEWANNVKESTIGGGLGGGFGAAYGAVDYAVNTWNTGRNIRNEANTIDGKTGIEQLVELGEGMKEGSRSRALAEQLRAKLDAGLNVNSEEINELAEETEEEIAKPEEETAATEKESAQAARKSQDFRDRPQYKEEATERRAAEEKTEAAHEQTEAEETIAEAKAEEEEAPEENLFKEWKDLYGRQRFGSAYEFTEEELQQAREAAETQQATDTKEEKKGKEKRGRKKERIKSRKDATERTGQKEEEIPIPDEWRQANRSRYYVEENEGKAAQQEQKQIDKRADATERTAKEEQKETEKKETEKTEQESIKQPEKAKGLEEELFDRWKNEYRNQRYQSIEEAAEENKKAKQESNTQQAAENGKKEKTEKKSKWKDRIQSRKDATERTAKEKQEPDQFAEWRGKYQNQRYQSIEEAAEENRKAKEASEAAEIPKEEQKAAAPAKREQEKIDSRLEATERTTKQTETAPAERKQEPIDSRLEATERTAKEKQNAPAPEQKEQEKIDSRLDATERTAKQKEAAPEQKKQEKIDSRLDATERKAKEPVKTNQPAGKKKSPIRAIKNATDRHISNYEIGQLANAIIQETGEEQAKVVKDTVERNMKDQLTDEGVDEQQAKVYASIIARYVMENEISERDRRRLAEDRAAIELWRSYNTNTGGGVMRSMQLGAEVAKATETQRSIMQTVGELTSKMKGPAGSSAMYGEVDHAIRNTKTVHEAIDMLKARNSALISDDYADRMKEALDNDKAAQKSRTFVDDAMKVRMAAMLYDTQAPKTNLSAETSKKLFEAAQAEAAEMDRMRLEDNPAVQAGKGTATFRNAAYGTKAWQDAIKPYSKSVRNQMGAVALAAQAFGHTVEFIDDPGRSMVNGWQMAHNGNIVINIATGMNHSMLATMAHEMTHWLEHNSESGYQALRRFVIENLRKNGRNVEQDIMETIRNQDRVRLMEEQEKGSSTIESLSFSDAVAELVAKGSEDIFTSREFKEAIAKESPSLYKKIKDHVKAIVARIDSAIEAATGLSMSREARALRNVRDEIAHVWLEAREEAVGRQRGEETERTEERSAQFSVEESDENTINAEDVEDDITVEQGEDAVNITNDAGEPMVTLLPGNTVAATQFSLSSYTDLNERKKMFNALKKAGYTENEINHWLESLDNIAAIIASDRAMYDFVADRNMKFLKPNGDVYKKTLDANTMCKKTRLYNGTFNVVQHMMPNTVFMPEDLIDLFNIMKDRDLETPCGFCYVQSRRRHLGTYTEEWLNKYKGEYIPTVDEVTTSDGLERLKTEHPQTYKDFVKAMNKKGVNNPKLVQQRTDYRGEIRRMTKSTVEYMKAIGGLRMQSFSDFEVVHMLDVMQAVMDMKAKGLTAQAYTKVPEFAWIFGPTGIKINLSLVGKGTGLDANGNLVFDDSEGIDHNEAFKLRDAYSKNVGTILVGINDDHIIAAMGDSRIDFIIPFHKSGWSENELKHMRGLDHYEDYTSSQNEYNIRTDEDGNTYTEKAESNIDPLSYWKFEEDGETNARIYLDYCKEHQIIPKFSQFLVDNGDGSYSLPEGKGRRSTNIREGYWKTLIDFKMYDNEGNGARQELVQPEFNMDRAYDVLKKYDGSHRQLPEDWGAAKEFVDKYKAAHPLDNVRTQYSVEESPDVNVERFMMGLKEFNMNTVQEKVMLRQWNELKGGLDTLNGLVYELDKQIRALEKKERDNGKLSAYDRNELSRLRNMRTTRMERMDRLQKEKVKATRDKGFARLMYQNESVMNNLVSGRTAAELKSTVAAMNDELAAVTKEMTARADRLKELAEKEAVLKVRQMFNKAGLKQIAAKLKTEMGSSLDNESIENRLALIALKMNQNQFDKGTTMELADMIVGKMAQKYDSYIINELRGSTIALSRTQLKELKAQGRTLDDVRADLAGTGIRIAASGNTTLENKWEDMCDLIPSLNPEETAGNQLDALLKVIRSEKQNTGYDYGSDENMLAVSGKILEAAQELLPEIVKDPKKLANVREVLKYVTEISGEARSAAESMDEISNMLSKLQRRGRNVSREAEEMSRNTQDAIEYFNELAEQSDAAMWKSERLKLIDQLKSENTQNILKEQAKWKERIEKDRTVRGMMETNLQLRQKINTNYGRIRKLLISETDQKNIPEHMKSLARHLVSKITQNDLTGRKISGFERKDLVETMRVMQVMDTLDDIFTPADLRMIEDEEAQAMVAEALADLEDGIRFYNASTKGADILTNLQGFRNALERINEAVTTITNVINAERQLSFWHRKMDVADGAKIVATDLNKSKYKGELKGIGSKAVNAARNAVVYGNTTPVYFFKNLQNRGMDMIWKDIEEGENRNGLEIQKAKAFIDKLSTDTKYKEWAGKKMTVMLGGMKREITVENAMEIYAIWRREMTENPEMSSHLEKGGIFIQQEDENKGKLRRERETQRATRVTGDEVTAMYDQMTDEQKQFMERMVSYLSNEMSALGNEASMRMYGIKKYKEKYYFPMKVWDGVKSARSDRGISGTDENRAAHKGWSKRRVNQARNALVIGNFVTDAVNHIVEMINYNTMAPSIENMNKVLNYQFTEGMTEDDMTNRNLRVMFQEAYGREALKYMETFMKDLNGGTVQDQRKTLRDRALSIFKKNAVAGSLSVVAQQPLSYIRASMMINPKYLAPAVVKTNMKDSYREMQAHSGLAVIKDMGRFDMNFGASAKEYITPETKVNAYEKISDILTKPPQLADTMTWTWMWSAVKAEQHAQHPEMDVKSEKFLNIVAERFNELMRRTQVYDSVLVKSSNMRSNNFGLKLITSFMAEPTLSLNVLADAVKNVGQQGGKAMLAKAGATFALSAVMQALVKGVFGTGRSPDKKKNLEENLLNKWTQSLISEANPLGLIPGFSDLIEVLKTGELKDDAMGAIGKLTSIVEKSSKAINGQGSGWYRDLEDTAAQLAQLFTNIPAKNIMRDLRAMYNWVKQDTYADRPTSSAVLKYQTIENLVTGDNMTGVVNQWLGDAGYGTSNNAYYERMYDAEKAGNKETVAEIQEYLTEGKGVKGDTISSNLKKLTKADDDRSYSERISALRTEGMKDSDIASWILSEYKEGRIKKDQAEKLWIEAYGKDSKGNNVKTQDDAYFKFEQAEWEEKSGNDVADSNWFRINDAVDKGNDAEYKQAVAELKKHGYEDDAITNHAVNRVMDSYKKGEITRSAAEKQLKKYNEKLTDNDIWFKLDLADYKKETGNEKASGTYYRLTDAVNANKAEDISKVIKDLMKHGITKEKIKNKLSDWKAEYLKADSAGRLKIKDALTKAYKAAGYTAADAQKTIDNWLKDKKKKK